MLEGWMMWIDPRIGRLVLIALGVLFFGYGAFKQTPELDGIKNASVYRLICGIFFHWSKNARKNVSTIAAAQKGH
jgi:hypothetical protein